MSRQSLISHALNFAAMCVCTLLVGCSVLEDLVDQTVSTPVTDQTAMPVLIPPKTVQQKHKVALLVPLSGLHAETGYSLQRAAEMGLFEHSNENLELIIKDTHGTADGARKATQEALAEKVELIIGPLLSHEVTAAALVARNKIPILAFSNNRAVATSSVFIMGYAPADQVVRIVNFAVAQGINDFTVVTPQNDYGSLVAAVFKSLNDHKLINVKNYIVYDTNQPANISPYDGIESHGIFFAEGGYTLVQVMDALQNQGVNFIQLKSFGISQWDNPQTLFNTRLKGAYYTNCNTDNRLDFEKKYEAFYHAKPLKITSMAYDAVALVTALISTNDYKPFTLQHLTQAKGFIGVDGLFRLMPNGYVERGLAIYEITGTQEIVVDPAPAHF